MAGFLDKAKQAAQSALDEAKKGIDSGQSKLDEVQAKRESDRLLAALGAAFYAEHRQGGSREAVNAALTAVDSHVQANGLVGFPAAAVTPAASTTASTTPPTSPIPPASPIPPTSPIPPASSAPTPPTSPPAPNSGTASEPPFS